MLVSGIVLAAVGASAHTFLQQKRLVLDRQEPGSWLTTCTDKGGLVTPWYDPAPGGAVPVFCVTATVCEGHLGRSNETAALPVTVFDRVTKLRVEQKDCKEKGETQCCTDILAKEGPADCAVDGTNAPCKLGAATTFKDFASFTQAFEPDAAAFKDDCTNKAPTTDSAATIDEKKLEELPSVKKLEEQKEAEKEQSTSTTTTTPPPTMCECETPGKGAAGHNKMRCDDGSTRYCSAGDECYNHGKFAFGDWAAGCRAV